MRRTVVGLVIGIAVGAAATYLLIGGRGASSPLARAPLSAGTDAASPRRDSPDVVLLRQNASFAERAAFFAAVARLESAADVEEVVRKLTASPSDPVQRVQIDALLERYYEIDAAQALALADELGASLPGISRPLQERRMRDDPDAALAELSRSAQQGDWGAVMTVFAALGGDEAALARVAAALPQSDADQFRALALLRVAEKSPRAAFAAALRLGSAERRNATAQAILQSWARTEPRDALAEVERIRDAALRSTLRESVLRGWQDTDAIVAYLDTLDAATRRSVLRGELIQRIAEKDPETAAALVNELPPGPERKTALMQIGWSYARKDADGALAWARGLDGQDAEAVTGMLGGVAQNDPLRAFDLAASLPEPRRAQAFFSVVSGVALRDQRQFEELARRVAGLPDGQTKSALFTQLVGSWAGRPGNLRPAMEWLLGNSAGVPPETFERAAYLIAQADVEAAATYVDRVPSAARAGWIGAVAIGYTRTDPQAALAFVERFRGDPAFDRAAMAVAPQLAAFDPPAAARLLASVGTRTNEAFGAEIQIAQAWAVRDPAAAAAWALDLPTMQRNVAVQMVAGAWGNTDRDAVRNWALGLPPGEKRDVALGAAVRTRGGEPPDAALLNAFSDDRARQGALMTSVMYTAATDPDAARRLMDTYITDPQMRAQAQQMIETIPRGGTMGPGGIGMPPNFAFRTGGPVGVIGGTPGGVVVGGAPAGLVFNATQGVAIAPSGGIVLPDGRMVMPRPPEPGLGPLPADALPTQRTGPPPSQAPQPSTRR